MENNIAMDIMFYEAMKKVNIDERKKMWETLRKKDFITLLNRNMPDTWLMEMFCVSRYKLNKRKEEIGFQGPFSKENLMNGLNQALLKNMMSQGNIQTLAVALTHFIFRNGPIEDMHADKTKNITNEDMKILNKYTVNHLAAFLILLEQQRGIELQQLISNYSCFGTDWDKVEYEDILKKIETDTQESVNRMLEQMKGMQ